MTFTLFDFWCQKPSYLHKKMELTLLLTASLVSTVHLQSMVSYNNTKVKRTCLERGRDHFTGQHYTWLSTGCGILTGLLHKKKEQSRNLVADVSRVHRSSLSARRKAETGVQEICTSNNTLECQHTSKSKQELLKVQEQGFDGKNDKIWKWNE